MFSTIALLTAMATSEPLLQKAAPNVNQTPSAAPLLEKAAPGPRSRAGSHAIHVITSAGSNRPNHGIGQHTTVHGGGWGWFGLIGIFGLIGFWRSSCP